MAVKCVCGAFRILALGRTWVSGFLLRRCQVVPNCQLGIFNLHVRVEYLFFIGSQLVALSPSGKLGVWHAMTQHWQTQDVMPIASFDTAGSILLLGCNNGCIYYIGTI